VLDENYTLKDCNEYYRKNTALIEIYYEQLNFESLRETPGYTVRRQIKYFVLFGCHSVGKLVFRSRRQHWPLDWLLVDNGA
jgi:hypothetical protein